MGILPPRCRHSSVVEQLFRKQQVAGSSPAVGSRDLNLNTSIYTWVVARSVWRV